jgi:ferredoxin--NADP+ reductase
MPALETNATVIRHEQLPGCLFQLWVRPDWDAATAPWEPGQFLRFGVPTGEDSDKKSLRALSMVSIDQGVIELYVLAVDDGTTSPALAALREGDRCYAEEKITGHFTPALLPTEIGKELWMVGTGAGIAPFVCMLRHDMEHLSRFERIVVVHSVRNKDYLSFGSELVRRASTDDRIHYIPVVTRSEERLSLRDGHCALRHRITTLLELGTLEKAAESSLDAETSVVMLCGNPSMVKDVTEALVARGLTKHRKKTPGNVISERYW